MQNRQKSQRLMLMTLHAMSCNPHHHHLALMEVVVVVLA